MAFLTTVKALATVATTALRAFLEYGLITVLSQSEEIAFTLLK
jgi:hypothetical protein